MGGMKLTIELPDSVFASDCGKAAEDWREIHEWIGKMMGRVMLSNEIHHVRSDEGDWREELLS